MTDLTSQRKSKMKSSEAFAGGAVVVSGIVAVASVVGLVMSPGAQWATPLIVACLGGLVGMAQKSTQREHSEKLAGIAEQLKRNSMLYERKLDAYAGATRSMRELIEMAEGVVRSVENHSGTPEEMPTVWFFRGATAEQDAFRRHGAVLRLLADPTTVGHLEAFSNALETLDASSIRDQDSGDRETLLNNVRHLADALPKLQRAYDGLLEHGRGEVSA